MISRMYFECSGCGGHIIVRAQVGYEESQAHSFSCPHCDSLINIKLDLSDPPYVGCDHDDSCTRSYDDSFEDGIIVNLGVGFTIPKSMVNKDLFSPALDFFMRLEQLKETGDIPQNGKIFQVEGYPGAGAVWRSLGKACRFHRLGKYNLRDKHLQKIPDMPELASIDEVLVIFIKRFIGERARDNTDVLVNWSNQVRGNYPGEFQRLIAEYREHMAAERFKEYVELLSAYFGAHHEFDQTIIFARFNSKVAEDAQATSTGFDKTKMFYGEAFELYGSHLDLAAALNNIFNARGYDKFVNIDLKKYRGSDKGGRCKCLAGNDVFDYLCEEYDNSIRNASHHRWFRLSDDHSRIYLKHGSGGVGKSLTYAEYTYRCNKLVIQILSVFLLEIEVFGIVNLAGEQV